MNIITFLGIWFTISIVVGLFVGRFICFGNKYAQNEMRKALGLK